MELIGHYRDAAVRARAAGFDAVELHGAHGYLIAQFMSADANKRADAFGGDFLGRMKFPSEIVKSIKRELGSDYPVMFRISGDEMVPGGRTIDETRAAAGILEQAGTDAIHVSIGSYLSGRYTIAPSFLAPAFNVDAAAEVKKSVTVPVIAVGRINDPFLAEDILRAGKADLIALGRAFLAEPEFPNKVAANAIEEIAPCLACNQGCIGRPSTVGHVACVVNPFTGKEGVQVMTPAEKPKKVMVVGGGPAGLEAAWIASARGHRVTCYEKEDVLGGQLRIAGFPPNKQDLLRAIKYFVTMGRKHGVTYKLHTEVIPALVERENPDVVILATGGSPHRPEIKGIDTVELIDAVDALEGKKKPGKRVLILGAGMIAAETADFLAQYGHQITIVGRSPALAQDMPASNRYFLLQRLREHGVLWVTGAAVVGFSDNEVVYQKQDVQERISGFDSVVSAFGYTPHNPLEEFVRDKVAEVHVIGDAVEARTAFEAIAEAATVAVAL